MKLTLEHYEETNLNWSGIEQFEKTLLIDIMNNSLQDVLSYFDWQ
jgi:hypothetical protein